MGSQLWDRFRRARGGIDPAVVSSTVSDPDPNRRAAGMSMLGIQQESPNSIAAETEDRQTVGRAFAAVREAGVQKRREDLAAAKTVAAQQKLQTTVQKEHGYVLQHDPQSGGLVPQAGPTGKPLKRVPGSTEHFVEEGNEGKFWNHDPATGGWVDAYENPKAVKHVKGGRVLVTPHGLPSKDVGEDEDSAVAALANAHVLQAETDIATKRRPTATTLHEASRDNKLAKDRLEYLTQNATPESEKITPDELAKMRLDAKAAYQGSKSRLNDAQEKHNGAIAETEEINTQLPLAKQSIRQKQFDNVLGVNFRERYRAGTVAQGLDAGEPAAVATAQAAQAEAHAKQAKEIEGLDAPKAGEAHGAFVKDLHGRIAAHSKAGEEHAAQVQAFNAPLEQNAQQQDMLKAQSDAHLAADPSGMIQVTVGGQPGGAWHKDEFAKVKQLEAQKSDYFKANERRVKFLNDRGNGLKAQSELLNADVQHAQQLAQIVGKKHEEAKQKQYASWQGKAGLGELPAALEGIDEEHRKIMAEIQDELPEGPGRDAAIKETQAQMDAKRSAVVDKARTTHAAAVLSAATHAAHTLTNYPEAVEQQGRDKMFKMYAGGAGVDVKDVERATSDIQALDFEKNGKAAVVLSDGRIAVNPKNADRLADYKQAVARVDASDEAKAKALAQFDEAHALRDVMQNPEKLKDGLDAAVKSGAISQEVADAHREQLERVASGYDHLVKQAGSDSKAKAMLRGAGKGAMFLLTAGEAGALGAEASVELGPFGQLVVGGLSALAGGTLGTTAYDQALDAAGEFSKVATQLNASAQLHPGWAAAGELAAFGASAPSSIANLTKLGGVARGAGESGLKAVGKVLGAGAVSGVAFETVLRPAFDKGLNLTKDLMGIQHEDVQSPTVESVLTNAALGMLLAGHGVGFKDYDAREVGDIMLRGRVRREMGVGMGVEIKPADVVEAMKAKGWEVPQDLVGSLVKPLDANEASVWESLAKKTKEMEETGLFDQADPEFKGARQAVVKGIAKDTPITSAVVEAKPREGGQPPEAEAPKGGLPSPVKDSAMAKGSDAELESHPEPLEARRAGLLRAIAQGADISTFSEENLNLLGLERKQGSDRITTIKDVAPDVHVDGKGNAIILDHARDDLRANFPATGDFLKMSEAEARAHFKSGPGSTTETTPAKPQQQPAKTKVAKPEESRPESGTKPDVPQSGEVKIISEQPVQDQIPAAKDKPRSTKPKEPTSNRQSRELLQTGFAGMGDRRPPDKLGAHIVSIVEAHEPLFDGVREGKLPDSRGFAYDPETGQLVIDPAQIVEAMSGMDSASLEAVTKHLETTIDEEVKHRVTMGLEKSSKAFAQKLSAVWDALPAEKKAESAAIYFNRPGAKFDHDHTARHEWLRQVLQKAERGEITEESLGSKNLLEKVRDMIKSLIDSLTAWVKSAPKELRAKLNDILKAARRAEAGLRGKKDSGVDASPEIEKPAPPEPNGTEPSRVGQAGAGDPEKAGKLAKKADEWEAMAAKHEADGNTSAAESARLKARKFREAAALETAATHLEDSGKVHNVEALKDAAIEAEKQASESSVTTGDTSLQAPDRKPTDELPAKPESLQPVQDGGNLSDAATALSDIEIPDDLASLGNEFKDLLGGDPISSPAPPKAELAESGFKSDGEAREQYRLRGLTEHGETFDEFLARNHCLELGGRNNFSIL